MNEIEVTARLQQVRELRTSERFDAYVAAARALAAAEPTAVEAQLEAAYACDRYGEESDAITYYDAAWRLGVPAADRKKFLLGYGSTLRNVGRLDESIERFRAAAEEMPDFPAYRAFLALSLHSAGRHDEAIVAAFDAVLQMNEATNALDGYQRALRHYRDEIAALKP
jgi:tetratricopeptide (TPR) repeat protein